MRWVLAVAAACVAAAGVSSVSPAAPSGPEEGVTQQAPADVGAPAVGDGVEVPAEGAQPPADEGASDPPSSTPDAGPDADPAVPELEPGFPEPPLDSMSAGAGGEAAAPTSEPGPPVTAALAVKEPAAETDGETARRPPARKRDAPRSKPRARRARVASHGGFEECHNVPDTDACQQRLSELFDETQRVCPPIGGDETCREARRAFEAEVVCIDEPDPEACRAQVRETPCFQDPESEACREFLDPSVLNCDVTTVECQTINAARSLYCQASQEIFSNDEERCPAGGGTEEEDRPGARGGSPLASAGGAGGGRSALVGLSDPGSGGDTGGSAEPARERPAAEPEPLAQTGPAPPQLLLVGLLALAGGAVLRWRARLP